MLAKRSQEANCRFRAFGLKNTARVQDRNLDSNLKCIAKLSTLDGSVSGYDQMYLVPDEGVEDENVASSIVNGPFWDDFLLTFVSHIICNQPTSSCAASYSRIYDVR
jgi:hypothetical protein